MEKIQLPLFEPKSDWTIPEIFPEFNNFEFAGIDLENKDEHLTEKGPGWPWKGGHIAGIAITLRSGNETIENYYPIGHSLGPNLDKKKVLSYVEDLCSSRITKVFHNNLYDRGWLLSEGIVVEGPVWDTMFGAALLDENRKRYGLDILGLDWLGIGKDEQHLKEAASSYGFREDVKKNLWKIPPQHVAPYAMQDATLCLDLWEYERSELESQGLMEVMQLEMDLVPLLLEMRRRGIRVNVDGAEEARKKLKEKFKDLIADIHFKYGHYVDVWSADSVAIAFDKANLSYPYTRTGKPSFTKEFLGDHSHELPRLVRQARQIDKTISVFLDGMILGNSHNGRIHTELHPLKSDDGGTVGGRFSSSNPNLQQATARGDYAPIVRGMFLPEPGTFWGALDYSSQEPRLTVHYAALTRQRGAEAAVKKYIEDPRTDYHQMVADFCGIERKQAKNINLGIAYGMGEVKLCRSLGLPTEVITITKNGIDKEIEVAGPEGKALMAEYHRKAPFVKGLQGKCSSIASSRGWIRTIGGRLCRFDSWEPVSGGLPVQGEDAARERYGNGIRRAYTHKALNRLIQGSAADMTKKAMLECWKQEIVPMLTMHDELDFSFETEKEWRVCEEIMCHSVELEVPVVVDCEFGVNWGEATHSWNEVINA